MGIKFFKENSIEELDASMNAWFRTNPIVLQPGTPIQFGIVYEDDATTFLANPQYIAMVLYEPLVSLN